MKALAAVALMAVVACGGGGDPGPDSSACGPIPSPAPTGDTAWRAGVEQDLLERYQARYPETFAGAWLDDAQQKAVLAFTDDPQPHLARLRADAKRPDLIDVVRHESSRADLTRRADQISEDEDALARRGIRLTSVGVDDRTNRIVVGVAEQNSDDAEYLCTVYGKKIVVQREAVPTPS